MNFSELVERLGVVIEPNLLKLALTHSTYAYENNCESNERLEFLGDSVLGLLVTQHVFKSYPDLLEGELSKLKNAVVSAKALVAVANQLRLGESLLLGKGEEASGGRKKPNLLADAFEAVLGAAFLSSGMPAAATLVEQFVIPLLANPDAIRENADPKTSLVELLHARAMPTVRYEISFLGPDHERVFTAIAYSGEHALGEGRGTTRRSAEMQAAVSGLASLKANA
jgi:ribonuclease-3